ncbi:MAG: UvrD-helicase domain-containing protein [Candidatus Sericytochromatia bacterium]|nr:UvrD-helicase domain-containing protein [Candidatus Tanganyikabacteria bacterium]
MSSIEGLNPSQLRAATHPGGPLLVLAGAGAGKTRVLTERVAWLLADGHAEPWQIMAVTFTNKAARQLRERIGRRLRPDLPADEAARAFPSMWVGTFHGLCARLLRTEADKLPASWGPGFSIYDTGDQERVMRQVLEAQEIPQELLTTRQALSAVSNAKATGRDATTFAASARHRIEDAIARAWTAYDEALARQNALDFDDLLLLPARLLTERPDVLAYWQQRFRHILVDEYQDTNQAQYRLIQLLSGGHHNLTVVGDVDQSIYSFRAADFRILLQFEQDHPDATRVTLEENYRSRSAILELANSLIAHNLERYPKTLRPVREGQASVQLYCASDEADEAEWIVTRIRQENLDPDDVCVLYRTHAMSRALEEAFTRAALAYRLVGGIRYFDRKEVRDALAWLRLAVNPRDDAAFVRASAAPRRGLGAATITRLQEHAARRGMALWPALAEGLPDELKGAARKKVQAYLETLGHVAAAVRGQPPSMAITSALELSGLAAELAGEGDDEAMMRLENMQELVSRAAAMEEAGEATDLEGFLATVPLAGADDEPGQEDGRGRATLMTLHAAKGLEYPIVFLIGLEEGVFPHQRALDDPAAMEEERRLCYVGVTRAEDRLFLSYAEGRRLSGQTRWNLPSRFVGEMPRELLPRTESRWLRRSVEAWDARTRREQAVRWMDDTPAVAPGDEPPVPEGRNRFTRPTERIRDEEIVWSQDLDLALPDYNEGDRVIHPRFGEGTVTGVHERRGQIDLTVEFVRFGSKTLDARHAGLTRP